MKVSWLEEGRGEQCLQLAHAVSASGLVWRAICGGVVSRAFLTGVPSDKVGLAAPWRNYTHICARAGRSRYTSQQPKPVLAMCMAEASACTVHSRSQCLHCAQPTPVLAPKLGACMLVLQCRAVAGESGVAFISSSASEFIEMYMGLGAARVRDVFNTVRAPLHSCKYGRCNLLVELKSAAAAVVRACVHVHKHKGGWLAHPAISTHCECCVLRCAQ